MTARNAMNDNADPRGSFRITGRMVLFGLVGFFGLISVANAVMIWFALSTNTGVVVSSSYRAGNEFQAEIDAAREQAARGWAVNVDIARAGEGARIDISVRDASGAPVSGLAMTARLANPADDTADRIAILDEGETGRYGGSVETVAPGNWTFVVDAEQGEGRVYRSENRVMLR